MEWSGEFLFCWFFFRLEDRGAEVIFDTLGGFIGTELVTLRCECRYGDGGSCDAVSGWLSLVERGGGVIGLGVIKFTLLCLLLGGFSLL